jgi:ABC-2 type transport system ATP-binding protein
MSIFASTPEMSLIVQNLTKVYGAQRAVYNISFSAKRGEILGFLGPNGAGKSTTMKIATNYLSATSGRVLVEGYDAEQEPMKVKRVVGYLPEHNPLYLDLYVHEYLQFVGSIYGMGGKRLKERIGEMIELCGLSREQNKRIEALSKGYRQRVGLAQAMLHDPTVLILDEPTSGLDPNQIIEIRNLIKQISKNKTVVFSTHIMQEVQALCDRVVVINKGEIVADDQLDSLMNSHSQVKLVIAEFTHEVDAELLSQLAGVDSVAKVNEERGTAKYHITPAKGVDIRPEIFRIASEKNLPLIGLKLQEDSLESIFRELTN